MASEATSLYELGLGIRREVLGTGHVTSSLQNEFMAPLQELATEMAWGKIWSRPQLGRRERSIAVLGMLAASNRPEELALHVRAAVNNGLSSDDIREVLLMSACYCGFPAAVAAFRIAEKTLGELASSGKAGATEQG